MKLTTSTFSSRAQQLSAFQVANLPESKRLEPFGNTVTKPSFSEALIWP